MFFLKTETKKKKEKKEKKKVKYRLLLSDREKLQVSRAGLSFQQTPLLLLPAEVLHVEAQHHMGECVD